MTNGDGAHIWTPGEVKAELVEAVRWVRFHGGPVGPSGIRSCMPSYTPSLEDHLEEGWGLPEVAGDDRPGDKKVSLPPTPERVEQLIDALTWISRYVVATNPGSAQMLALWVRCKVYRRDFGDAVEGRLSRSSAYRLRDRGLGIIATRLTAEGRLID
ncbi:MAG: hypothetical protein E6Q97_31945 [Desulfurellales bacterium]|nr:MAG: hypothetical protein E6Q97_31945 [Desulfurellales bacterium]